MTLPFENYEQALDRAAEIHGIEPRYWDIFGNLHITSAQTKKSILGALGVPVESTEQIEAAIDARVRDESSRLLPACLVVSENERPLHIPVRLSAASESARIELRLETGEAISLRHDRSGAPLVIDQSLPLGYHQLQVQLNGGESAVMHLIVTPDRAFMPASVPRAAGIAIALYGLRSARNWGCGDVRDLRAAIDWAAGVLGVSFLALNPLHAIPNRRPYNTSPYLPTSVFYRNGIYLDVEAIEDFQNSPRVQRHWRCPQVQAKVQALRDSTHVEHELVWALKLKFLKLSFLHFLRQVRQGTAEGAKRFLAYVEREGELLHRFATYCALDEHIHRTHPDIWIWPDWPAAYRYPDSAAVAVFQKKKRRSVMFYKYVQWRLDEQLADAQEYAKTVGLPIGLYHDLALATDRCGADLWAYRPYYVAGCRVGSPPDAFSPSGQDWAFPPPFSERHRAVGYRLFAESIRKSCRHGGALRIDHVMRFFRLYWIPDGTDAAGGTYVRDRSEDLVRILALESVRNQVVVIGEDLGTVEPYIRETLSRFGILSYRLLYFERKENGEFRQPEEYPAQALVSSTTHDLPTLAGFWINEDIEARRRAGLIDAAVYRAQIDQRSDDKQKMLDALFRAGLMPDHYTRVANQIPELTGELHNAVIGFLAKAPSMFLVLNQEDLTKEIEQQNLPGTTWQYPNWGRKMTFTVEQLSSEAAALNFARMLRNWLARSGRETIYRGPER